MVSLIYRLILVQSLRTIRTELSRTHNGVTSYGIAYSLKEFNAEMDLIFNVIIHDIYVLILNITKWRHLVRITGRDIIICYIHVTSWLLCKY